METYLQSKEVKVPKAKATNKVPSAIDFNFKSSFARSLSCSNGGNNTNNNISNCSENQYETTKSLDFEINLSPCKESVNLHDVDDGGGDGDGDGDDKQSPSLDMTMTTTMEQFSGSNFNRSDEDKERQLWTNSKTQQQQVNDFLVDPICCRSIYSHSNLHTLFFFGSLVVVV